jgi:hypothetical protein
MISHKTCLDYQDFPKGKGRIQSHAKPHSRSAQGLLAQAISPAGVLVRKPPSFFSAAWSASSLMFQITRFAPDRARRSAMRTQSRRTTCHDSVSVVEIQLIHGLSRAAI